MSDAKRDDLVQIHRIILEPEERQENLPSSTASVPYECWIKGFLVNNSADMGEDVRIRTFAGREMSGTLYRVNPRYDHDFGEPRRELLSVGDEALIQLNSGQREIRE